MKKLLATRVTLDHYRKMHFKQVGNWIAPTNSEKWEFLKHYSN